MSSRPSGRHLPPRTPYEKLLGESVTLALYKARLLKDRCCKQINLRLRKLEKKYFQARALSVATWEELDRLVTVLEYHANLPLESPQEKLEHLAIAARLIPIVSSRLCECGEVNLIHPPELDKDIGLLREVQGHIEDLKPSLLSRINKESSMK